MNENKKNKICNDEGFGSGFGTLLSSIQDKSNIKSTTSEKNNNTINRENKSKQEFNLDEIEKNIFNFEKPNINNQNQKKEVNIHSGHRQRARERFLLNPEKTSDYDILELLLFSIIPRADTKPMAKKLIDKFKNLRGIYEATKEEIDSIGVNGYTIKYLFTLLHTINNRILEETIKKQNIVLSNTEILKRYCRSIFKTYDEEQFFILFLDNKLNLISTETFGIINTSSVLLSQKNIIQTALQLKAKNVILVHNHPSNNCQPSQDDITTTQTIKQTLSNIDIDVIEHLIIGTTKDFSFLENNLI